MRIYSQTSSVAVASLLVDDVDKDLERFSWRLDKAGYVIRGPKLSKARPGMERVHRVVLARVLGRVLQAHELVDHVNGNRADNRRENLRLATKSQNGMNRGSTNGSSSRFAGVAYDKRKQRWFAKVTLMGKQVAVGRYHSEEEAAWMRDQFALALHGDFARLNFEYEVPA